jgi:hypothetical protein
MSEILNPSPKKLVQRGDSCSRKLLLVDTDQVIRIVTSLAKSEAIRDGAAAILRTKLVQLAKRIDFGDGCTLVHNGFHYAVNG